jgi:hypothetical protein
LKYTDFVSPSKTALESTRINSSEDGIISFMMRSMSEVRHVARLIMLALGATVLGASGVAQVPVAELPRVKLDTTWNQPTRGKTWHAHTSDDLATALSKSAPGDVIVLDAGATYSAAFQLPPKDNPDNKWIYVVSSGIGKLPAGKRVSPGDAASMAKVVTPSVAAAFQVNGGANHWRLAGLELTTNSNYCTNGRCSSYFLVGSQSHPTPLPDSIVIDRCYVHGDATHDMQTGVVGNGSNYAVIDSYFSDIHSACCDSQAFAAYDTPGPIKLVNSHLEAAGENVMFGGSGGNGNRGVPSDIEVVNNDLFKPLAWAVPGMSLPPDRTMVVKNAFELKSAQRVLFDHNTIENVWAAGQIGYAIVLTVRASQSGDFTVVSDITITNNVLKNVVSGFNSLAKDDQCGKAPYEKCQNAGGQARWRIANNLILFYDPKQPGGNRNLGFAFNGGTDRINGVPGTLKDVVFQHNTMVASATAPCWNALYFSSGGQKPPISNLTNNIWILDNVLCRQPTGDWGQQGMSGLTQYMGAAENSSGLDKRFYGNVILVSSDDKPQSFPPHNLVTSKSLRWVDATKGDYELAQPKWTETSDGKAAGIDFSALPQ